MKINIMAVPKALLYFILGVIVNAVLYYTFGSCTDCVGLLTILNNAIFDAQGSNMSYVIFFGIMTISIIITLVFPLWIMLEKPEENKI